MTNHKLPSLADLIAATPGAQTREDARASIKARRDKLLNASAPLPPADFAATEPLPLVDEPDTFAKEFWQRRILPRRAGRSRGLSPTTTTSPSRRSRTETHFSRTCDHGACAVVRR
jgi:hypothetical protein